MTKLFNISVFIKNKNNNKIVKFDISNINKKLVKKPKKIKKYLGLKKNY